MTTKRRRVIRGAGMVGAVSFGFALLIVLALTTAWLVLRTRETTRLVSHTLEVQLQLAQFRTNAELIETGRRGYLLEPSETVAQGIEKLAEQMPATIDALRALTADNPAQGPPLDELARASANYLAFMRETIAAARASASAGVASFNWNRNAQLIRHVREAVEVLATQERELQAQRQRREERFASLSYLVIGLAALALLVVAAGTIWATRRSMSDLRRVSLRLSELNDDLEGAVAERTAELTRANEEIQRFAYIVSHDLRSPLVNVMGFTSELEAGTASLSELVTRAEAEAPELLSEDARLAAREDLPEAIGFIRASTQKMDRLINAILRLSREGRRQLVPETLDMNEMVEGIEASLRHRLDETGVEIERGALPAIRSDRVAVEQILSNLVENAVKYLSPDRAGRVRVSGHLDGDRAVFEVEDNGRGIDPRDHERIFDLFRRSGAQDRPGEGIGLAHVRTLAYRLGGTVSCRSGLDEGATFRLSILRNLPAAEGSKTS